MGVQLFLIESNKKETLRRPERDKFSSNRQTAEHLHFLSSLRSKKIIGQQKVIQCIMCDICKLFLNYPKQIKLVGALTALPRSHSNNAIQCLLVGIPPTFLTISIHFLYQEYSSSYPASNRIRKWI